MSSEKLEEDEIEYIFDKECIQNRFTPECSKLAAGSALEAMKDVLSSPCAVKSAFCLVRPPGHHASTNYSNGTCFFNNAAVAAHFAKEIYGLKKILILDWDVHHGEGTQEIFYESSEVLFVSIHRWENGNFFPFKDIGNYTYTGKGEGEGFNINVPWNTTEKKEDESKVGSKEYKFLFENLIFGIIREFSPELIIVSAGFDSALGDPLGKQQVTHELYHWISINLQAICPKILMMLEGGYNMDTLVSCATLSVKALMGYEKELFLPDVNAKDILPAALECIKNAAKEQSKYWKTAKDCIDMLSGEN